MCKVMLISTALFIIYTHSIAAIQCPSCDEISFDITNTSVSVHQSYCNITDISAAACRSELFVDLVDPYPAVISYITVPTNALVTNNDDRELLSIIAIPLDTQYPYGSVIYTCYDTDLCNNNSIVQNQYEQLSQLNYTQLKTELTDLLYNNQSILKHDAIECYNRQNKIVKCAIDWQCQATLSIERGRLDSLSTTCVPDRRPGSRAGLTVQSKSVGDDYKKTSISYICNRNKCNDPAIVRRVRQILVNIKLVDSKANNVNCLSIILLIICTVIHI